MKKITLFALLMGAALCASAATPISKKVVRMTNAQKGEVVCRVAAPGTVSKTYTVKRMKAAAPAPAGYANVTLAAGDVWGDGSGYQMLLDADANTYGTIIPETGSLNTGGDVSSDVYAQFEYKIPENADGALATQNIIMNGEATIQIPAGVYDYCITNPTAGERMWIATDNGNFPGRGSYEFESGVSYIITISLGGSNDRVDMEIEDPYAPGMPADLVVQPAATTAEVTWTAVANNDLFNLRYREYVDPSEVTRLINLPSSDEDVLNEQLEGVYFYDADGDGHNWSLAYSDNSQTDVCFYSASYEDYEALYPDNWLIINTKLGGTFKFKAQNQSATWPDVLGVFVCTNQDFETVSEFVQVGENIVPPEGTFTQYEFDLSAFEGLGCIAIRHYNSDDQLCVYVDDIEIITPDNKEIQEWIVLSDVASPYTISGLTPETTYEVQVQGVKDTVTRAIKASNWSESVIFTTPSEEITTAIEEINAEVKGDNNYYNMMGQKVVGNLPAGIYIHNGKKIVVR